MPVSRIPTLRRHKPSGRAVVTLNGRDHYLGKHGTVAARKAYERLIAEWLVGDGNPLDRPEGLTVVEVVRRYMRFAKAHYRKHGVLTNEYVCIKSATVPLVKLYARTPAADFSPKRLKAVRKVMIDEKLARSTISDKVFRIKRMFRWAVEEELVSPAVFQGLQAVQPLRKGRTAARETEPVTCIPEADIEAVLPLVSGQVAAMIRLQLLTAMRPGEVVIMRMADIDRTGPVWLYRPEHHKTEHLGIDRVVPIGPRAQETLGPWLRADPEAYLFDPRQAENERSRRRRARAKSPRRDSTKRSRTKRGRSPRDRYDVASYRRSIRRACDARDIDPWSPNRLRHNAATDISREYDEEVAQVVLGHRSRSTTRIYAQVDRTRAIAAIGDMG